MNRQPKKNYKQRYERLLRLSTYLWLNVALFAVGLSCSIWTSSWIQGVGEAILASSVVGLLFAYQVVIDRQFDEARDLYDHWGLLSIEDNRSDKEMYGDLMQTCSQSLDIMAVSLSRFCTDFGSQLTELDRRGVKMRFLLLDPESQRVRDRAEEDRSSETPTASVLKERIIGAAEEFRRLHLANLTVRYYRCTPSVNYFRIDNRTFIGSYFVGIPSRNSVTLFCRTGDRLAEWYTKHFEAVWTSTDFSRPI